MARKAKVRTVADDQARAAMTPEDRFNAHFPTICAAKREFDRIQREAKTANSAYRHALKSFKRDGGNADMMVQALSIQKRDPDEVDRDFRDLNAYLRLMGVPVGTQLGLDLSGRTIATAVEDDAAAASEDEPPDVTMAEAYHQGEAAGKAGKSFDVCNYSAGRQKVLRDAWQTGWRDAQEAMAKGLAKPRRGAKAAAQASATA